MREQRTVQRECGNRVVAWVVGLAMALGLGSPARAQVQVQSRLPAFGMIGLAEGQVAILNLVLVDPQDENHPGCRLTASFVDATGQVFSDVRGSAVRRTFTLQPQIATGLRLRSADILATGQLRRSIRAVLTPVPTVTAPSDCTCLIASLELVNPDGRTGVLDLGLGNGGQVVPGGGNPGPSPGGCPGPQGIS